MKSSVILISGHAGVGSTTTSKLLSQKLNMDFFSPGRLFKDIASGRITSQPYCSPFKKICEKNGLQVPSFSEKDDSNGTVNLWKTDFGRSPQFHKSIDELQQDLAEKGKIIIDGKISFHVITSPCLKIWLKSNINERAHRLAQRDSIEFSHALEIIQKRQQVEKEEWKKIYGIDTQSSEGKADFVIDTTNLIPEEVVEKIISIIKSRFS